MQIAGARKSGRATNKNRIAEEFFFGTHAFILRTQPFRSNAANREFLGNCAACGSGGHLLFNEKLGANST